MNHIELVQKKVYIYRNNLNEEWKTTEPLQDLTGITLVRTFTEYGAVEVPE